MPKRSALFNSILSFGCGLLVAFLYQVYCAKRVRGKGKNQNTDVICYEFDRIYDTLAGIERQLDHIRLRLNQGEDKMSDDQVDDVVRQFNCQPNNDDIFYDTTERQA